ncbi:MAG: thioredoxin family protein [Saprospiraceae bacterium]
MNNKTFIYGLVALIGFGLCYWQLNDTQLASNTVQAGMMSTMLDAPLEEVNTDPTAEAVDITWITWEEAVAANKTNPKKIIIDVYTDWCGWCKRMDATTFKDPKVEAYIAQNFYAVKFNAEQREDIVYDGKTFAYKQNGRRGVHELAASLLDNRLSYPSVVYFNGDMERIMISAGYKDADKMLKELMYANGEIDSAGE